MPLQNSTVRFLLNNTPCELDLSNHPVYQPSTTVLNFLRSLPGHKGVKEGCAEGDCGACTIVIAEPGRSGRLIYKAVNSCLLFLPFLQGKQLITVEQLSAGNKLHPVQQMMIDEYGTQCGFCTPGVVMSLFALYKSSLEPSRENAIQALSGNLCRCTGYQPILEVALKALADPGPDHFNEKEKDVFNYLLPFRHQSLSIGNGKQAYFRPGNLEEALQIRITQPDALPASGATDLAVRQSKKHEFLPAILDLSGIDELKLFTEDETGWTLGSGLAIEELRQRTNHTIPLFEEVFRVFASKQIRNLATLGGNIASASPIGDSLPVLFALDASVELISTKGSRNLPVEQFITAYRLTALLPGEIIRSVFIPKPKPGEIFRFYKVSKRKELDISTLSLAAKLCLDRENQIENVILAFGGMADRPSRAVKTESWLRGKTASPETAEQASLLLKNEFTPISDARSGKEARTIAAGNLLIRLFAETNPNTANHE